MNMSDEYYVILETNVWQDFLIYAQGLVTSTPKSDGGREVGYETTVRVVHNIKGGDRRLVASRRSGGGLRLWMLRWVLHTV